MSERPTERARAALLCLDCPARVFEACRAYADEIHAIWSVYGGADYTHRSNQTWRKK